MKIALLDYGAGNLFSVANALEKLKQNYAIISDAKKLSDYDKVILPGVGAAAAAMQNLNERGFAEVLKAYRKPFLGICLGLQLLADYSTEGNVDCLKIVSGKVDKFKSPWLKVPQVGWNKVSFVAQSPLADGLNTGLAQDSYFYFVNSYYLPFDAQYSVAVSDYGQTFTSIMQKENFYAVQFHPEKSGEAGLKLLSNFCEKC